jgi:hypothetical protein
VTWIVGKERTVATKRNEGLVTFETGIEASALDPLDRRVSIIVQSMSTNREPRESTGEDGKESGAGKRSAAVGQATSEPTDNKSEKKKRPATRASPERLPS